MTVINHQRIRLALLALVLTAPACADVWQPEALPFDIEPGGGFSMAIDDDGNQAFSYAVDTGGLFYGHHDGSGWTAEQVATGLNTGDGSALRFVNNTPHIAYGQDLGSNIGVYHAWGGPGSWQTEAISEDFYAPRHSTLQADINQHLTVAWVDQHPTDFSMDTLNFAWHDGATWSVETVQSTPRVSGNLDLLLTGPATEAGLAYVDDSGSFLFSPKAPVHAERSSGSWTTDVGLEGTQSNAYANYLSAVVQDNGLPAMAYIDTSSGDLMYARQTAGGWSMETVADLTAGSYADRRYLDLAMDGTGVAHLMYYDPDAGELRYRHRLYDQWSRPLTIATVKAHWVSLEIDRTDVPRFSYFDDDNDLTYYGYGEQVPEPGTIGLVAIGLAALVARRRNRCSTREQDWK